MSKAVEMTPPPRSEFERVDISRFHLHLDASGCVQIPLEIREAMLAQGTCTLLAEVVDGELRLLSPKGAIRKVRRMIAESDWGGGSLVDELLAERRAEALRDEAEALLPTSDW
jgi:hypothetical protein